MRGQDTQPPDFEPDFDEIDFVDEDGAEQKRWILSRNAQLRLDKYLQNRVKGSSRSQIQKLIDLGGVKVNNHPAKASQKLREGDVVDIILPPRPATHLVPENIPLDILYEDDDMIVVNKQADLIVHPARSHLTGTLLNAMAYHFLKQQGVSSDFDANTSVDQAALLDEHLSSVGKEGDPGRGEGPRPGIVHRLDKNTTGVIILAKRDETHWKLSKQFENRTNLKCYLALVHGCPEQPGGAIDAPIGKHPSYREAMAVRNDATGRDSLTLYRVRERYKGYTLIELELKTGRTHQIRVHLSYIGCPIVGDIIYGGEPVGEPELLTPTMPAGARPFLTFARSKEDGRSLENKAAQRDDIILATPALHAALLRIRHPITNQDMTFTAPLHNPFLSLIHRLREQPDHGPTVTDGTHIDLSQAVPQIT